MRTGLEPGGLIGEVNAMLLIEGGILNFFDAI